MNNNKKVVTIISIMLAIAMILGMFSAILVANGSVKVQPSGLSAGINTLSSDVINPDLDSKLNGDYWSLKGTTRTFTETQWNGRIETKLHLGGISYIYINVDPRNVAWNDDIIIEYRSYYREPNGNEMNQKIQHFYAEITFHTEKYAYISQTCEKRMDSQAGFTKQSGKGSVNWIKVSVKITTLGGIVRDVNFDFAI